MVLCVKEQKDERGETKAGRQAGRKGGREEERMVEKKKERKVDRQAKAELDLLLHNYNSSTRKAEAGGLLSWMLGSTSKQDCASQRK